MELGKGEEGLAFLEQAVRNERSPENLFSLARGLAFPGPTKEGSREAQELALGLLKEASALSGRDDDPMYPALTAGIALSLQRIGDFRKAVAVLAAEYPQDMSTHYFTAIRAAIDEDWILAEDEIAQAERLGLRHDVAARFLESGVHLHATVWRGLHIAAAAMFLWVAGLLALLVAGQVLSGVTLRSIERADGNGGSTARESDLRAVYRALIRVAATYYYLSMPFVIVLVIGGTAAVIYGFIAMGQVPIKLVAVMAFGALMTTYKMIQSLFIRIATNDPGRALDVAEAPGLWSLTQDVADRVGTRPVDEIRVTPGTELAVYEQGTAHERSRDLGRRVLVLGVGLLNGFRQSAFRAVLAHEYGHFAHRDTAGGDVALRVRQDIMKFALAMARQGQAVWWNLAFQFLRVYHVLFRRISNGATRLQEVLADRVAAVTFGAKPFEEGLRHVIRRHVEFESSVNGEIEAAIRLGRALQNLYAETLQTPQVLQQNIEERVQQAVSRPTSRDDTHPGPLERFRLVSAVASTGESAASGQVWIYSPTVRHSPQK